MKGNFLRTIINVIDRKKNDDRYMYCVRHSAMVRYENGKIKLTGMNLSQYLEIDFDNKEDLNKYLIGLNWRDDSLWEGNVNHFLIRNIPVNNDCMFKKEYVG